jgi:hypothetical protein
LSSIFANEKRVRSSLLRSSGARFADARKLQTASSTPQSPNFTSHDRAAAFGSDLSPYATKTGKNFRGPQDPAVICPASGTERAAAAGTL